MNKKRIIAVFVMSVLIITAGCSKTMENNSAVTGDINSQAESTQDRLTSETASNDYIGEDASPPSSRASETKKDEAKETKLKPTVTSAHTAVKQTVCYTFPASTFDNYDNKTPLSEKLTRTYDEKDIVNKYLYYKYYPYSGDRPASYSSLNEEYPIECVRKCDENIYAVYKTAQGGLLYVFFTPDMQIFYSAYSMKKLSHADFNGVKPGDSFEKIAVIDPAVNAMKQAYEADNSVVVFHSFHILSDGIYAVVYNESESGQYTVWKTGYFPNYTFNYYEFFVDTMPKYAVDNTDYSYKILNDDYITD